MSTNSPVHVFGGEKRSAQQLFHEGGIYPLEDPKMAQQLAFWKAQTGIEDEEELKRHIVGIQEEAYSRFAYGCIRFFIFLWFRVPLVPGYDRLLKIITTFKDPIFLDVGCCFGTDSRKIAADGWPAKNVVATDIQPAFWDLGHKLFCTTPESFPATFLPGDILDPTHLALGPVLYADSTLPADSSSPPPLSTLTSLNPLRGHVAAIHAGALLHLFTEEQQTHIVSALAGLLAPVPGAMLAGSQSGANEKGVRVVWHGQDGSTLSQFCHSPESWKELIDGVVFQKGTVKVEVELVKAQPDAASVASGGGSGSPSGSVREFLVLMWSVTRL